MVINFVSSIRSTRWQNRSQTQQSHLNIILVASTMMEDSLGGSRIEASWRLRFETKDFVEMFQAASKHSTRGVRIDRYLDRCLGGP